MKNPIFKQLYKGHGIYWHGANDYGNETRVLASGMQAVKNKIDAKLKAEAEAKPDHLKFWDTLTHEERNKWRRICQTTELSASELAYTNKAVTQ